MLYMLGLVLPILGLVILPMVAAFTPEVSPYVMAGYISIIYNLTIPLALIYLTKTTLSKRPTGYGEFDVLEGIASIKDYTNLVLKFGTRKIIISPLIIGLTVGIVFSLIGLIPFALQFILEREILLDHFFIGPFLGYKLSGDVLLGPYSVAHNLNRYVHTLRPFHGYRPLFSASLKKSIPDKREVTEA